MKMRIFLARYSPIPTTMKRCGIMRPASNIRKAPITFNTAVFHTKIKDLQVTVDAGGCSSRIVLKCRQGSYDGRGGRIRRQPGRRPRSVAGRQLRFVRVRLDVDDPVLADRTGIRKGNRLPSVPKFQIAAAATYGSRFERQCRLVRQCQRPACRQPLHAAGRSGASTLVFVDGTNGLLWFDPVTGAFDSESDDRRFVKLPSYNLVNLSAGIEWDSGLELVAYVNNLFDENRQAVVRPRTWRPGAAGLQHRHAADDRHDVPVQIRFDAGSGTAATSAAPAASAAASGDADLLGRLGDPGDGCLPAAASASPAAASAA